MTFHENDTMAQLNEKAFRLSFTLIMSCHKQGFLFTYGLGFSEKFSKLIKFLGIKSTKTAPNERL